MASYEAYFAGKLTPYELPDEEIQRALKAIEGFPKP
jgi:tryptophan synthase beta chain